MSAEGFKTFLTYRWVITADWKLALWDGGSVRAGSFDDADKAAKLINDGRWVIGELVAQMDVM